MPKAPRDPDVELFTNSPCRDELRDLLFSWDPIGFAPELPRDEYDCLIPTVVHLMREGATDSEIVTRLEVMVRDHFGIQAGGAPTLSFAKQLRDWYHPHRAAWQTSLRQIDQLRTALEQLSMAPERQLQDARRLGVSNDEIALQFDDVSGTRRKLVAEGSLSSRQAEAIAAVERRLTQITSAGPGRWQDQALIAGEDWSDVRRLAKLALKLLSASHSGGRDPAS